MRNAFLFLIVLPAAIAASSIVAVACGQKEPETPAFEDLDAGDEGSTIPSTTNPTSNDASNTATPGTGLPCDIQGLLENRCLGCHGEPAAGGPPPLNTFADLTAPSKKDTTKTMAVAALELMKAKTMPPSPAVAPDADEIATWEEWTTAGTPRNPEACTETDLVDGGGAPKDGGLLDGGVPDGGCTSGKTWAQGNTGSPLMHPGAACNGCHQQAGGPNLRIAGTVYPTLREPNDCNGSAPPPTITLTVTDARNKTFTATVNAAGNFSIEGGQRPRLPITAKLTDGNGKTRAMTGKVTSGDCNSCHTQAGAKNAPGRILAPQ